MDTQKCLPLIGDEHIGMVTSVAISPDGKFIVSGSSDGSIKIWCLEMKRYLRTLPLSKITDTSVYLNPYKGDRDWVESVAISPDSRKVISGHLNGDVKVWDINIGQLDRIFEGRAELTFANSNVVYTYEMESYNSYMSTFEGHVGWVLSVAVSPDGRYAVSGSADGTVRKWGLGTEECSLLIGEKHWNKDSFSLSHDGRGVVDQRNWDMENFEMIIGRLHEFKGIVECLAITPDSKQIITGTRDGLLRVWDSESGKCLNTFEGHTDRILSISISPDGGRVVTGSRDRTIRVWNLLAGNCSNQLEKHMDMVTDICMAPDGQNAVSGSYDGDLMVWDVQHGKRIQTLSPEQGSSIFCVNQSYDAQKVVSGDWFGRLIIWDLKLGKYEYEIRKEDGNVLSVSFSPDGKHIVSDGKNGVTLWNPGHPPRVQKSFGSSDRDSFKGCRFRSLLMGDDGRTVLSTYDKRKCTLVLWDLETGESLCLFRGHEDEVQWAEISPDGRRMVSASSDCTLRLWDLKSGECLRVFRGHESAVQHVAITPEGLHMVSASSDRTLRLWDLESGMILRVFRGHEDEVQWVAIFPDGCSMVSACKDDTLRLWDLSFLKAFYPAQSESTELRDGENSCNQRFLGIREEECLFTYHYSPGRFVSPFFSPVGKRIVFGTQDGQMHFLSYQGNRFPNREDDLPRTSLLAISPEITGNTKRGDLSIILPSVDSFASGECLRGLGGHLNQVADLEIVPEKSKAITVDTSGELRIWNFENGECMQIFGKSAADNVYHVLRVSPDGRRAIFWSREEGLRILNLVNGKCLQFFKDEAWENVSIVISSDSRRAFTWNTGKIHLWDLENGNCLQKYEGNENANVEVIVTSSKGFAYSGGKDGGLRMWDLENATYLGELGRHSDEITQIVITHDERFLLSASADKTVCMWDLNSRRRVRVLTGHEGKVIDIYLASQNNRVITTSSDQTLRLWDLESGISLRVLEGFPHCMKTFKLTPDGCCAVLIDGKILRSWGLKNGEFLHEYDDHEEEVLAFLLTSDGKQMISGGWDGTVRVWDLEKALSSVLVENKPYFVDRLQLSCDDRRLLIRYNSAKLSLWDLESKRCLRTEVNSYGYSILGAGRVFRLQSGSDTISVWDLESGEDLNGLEGGFPVCKASVNRDRSLAVSCSGKNTLRQWDLRTGKSLRLLEGHEGYITCLVVAPDGSCALSGDFDGELRLWNLENGECVHVLRGHSGAVRRALLTPDGSRAISAGMDGTLRVWNLQSGECQLVLEDHTAGIRSVDIAPDGSFAVSASMDGTLRLWNLKNGKCSKVFKGHVGGVEWVSISPNGCSFLSAGCDAKVILWDPANAIPVRLFEGHESRVSAVAFSADGRYAVSASDDRTLRLWEVGSGKCLSVYEVDKNPSYPFFDESGKRVVCDVAGGKRSFLLPERCEPEQQD